MSWIDGWGVDDWAKLKALGKGKALGKAKAPAKAPEIGDSLDRVRSANLEGRVGIEQGRRDR